MRPGSRPPVYLQANGAQDKWITKPMKNIHVVLKQEMSQKFPVKAQKISSIILFLAQKKTLDND